MLQLFKKNRTVIIDQQIYNDVYSAQELLLAEANKILSSSVDFNSGKYQRLEKLNALGFSKAEEVAEYKAMKAEVEKHDQVKKLIDYYNFGYPLNKFITEDAIRTICGKYGLLLADVGNYIAEIPEENQKHIVNFRIKAKDIRNWFTPENERGWGFLGFPDADDYLRYTALIEQVKEERIARQDEMMQGTDLKIVAPEHKLNMRGKEGDGNRVRIKDPIVLQPVNSGYLIVTSWGLEANDEAVVHGRLS